MSDLWYQIGITSAGAVGVVIATTLLYLAFTLVVRLSWRHFGASRSSFELALVTVLGAIVGRTMLGNSPTLVGGLIALMTLLTLERVVGLARRSRRYSDLGHVNGVVVMTGSDIDTYELRRLGISERDLWTSLRRHGIHNCSEVGVVVVELDGKLSVLRAGVPVDRNVMIGVRGAGDLPDEFYAD